MGTRVEAEGVRATHGSRQTTKSRRWLLFEVVAVIAVVTWAATHAGDFAVVRHRLAGVALVGISFSVVWWSGFAGLALMLTSLEVPLRRDPQQRGGGPLALSRHIRALASMVLESPPNSRRFKLGWYLNTIIGGAGPGLVLAVGVLVALPRSAWALAVPPATEALASICVRMPIHRALVRSWREQEAADWPERGRRPVPASA